VPRRHPGPASLRLNAQPYSPAQAAPAIRASRSGLAHLRASPGRGFPDASQLSIDVLRVRPSIGTPACLRDLPPKE
jgi:hypothetical protein